MAQREELNRNAAHRVPDEDRVVEIETEHHAAKVLGQVVE